MTIELRPEPLTRERFAPYGDVVTVDAAHKAVMNHGRFERFDDLSRIDLAESGTASLSIARCRVATALPYRIEMVERHPRGSQAFIPLTPCKLIVVVAPPQADVEAAELRAFVSNGRQGINYRRGTWHMPLIAFDVGREYLIIERADDGPNCDQHWLDEAVLLLGEN
jgi:ureidoglycolate lyase